MEDSKKLGELLSQLKEYGYDVKESTQGSEKTLLDNSAISEDTINRLNSNEIPNFEAFVAWSKNF